MRNHQFKRKALSVLAAAVAVTFATNASAWNSPTHKRYLTGPISVCDQGVFYVGGAPKLTAYGSSFVAGTGGIQQIIIGDMYVDFQRPNNSRMWPLIIIHGSGYTGTCVESTANGSEGWRDYLVRSGISTFVADQAGRGRSGFDKSTLHEARALLTDANPANDAAGAALLPNIGSSTSSAWTSWFGHIVPAGTDITTGQMVRHGAPAIQGDGTPAPGQDPLCTNPPTNPAQPAHCKQTGQIAMEPEHPEAVDQCIASRTGKCANQGNGTLVPDVGGHVNPAFPLNDRYLALDAYKFNVPNAESTLPGSSCPSCVPTTLNSTNTWTPKAAAELVHGLGGAMVATHSQSGQIGMNMVRVLRENGHLGDLKGLIQDEGGAGTAASGTTTADFLTVPYLYFIGDYTGNSAGAQTLVANIKAAGGTADYIKLDQPGYWQGAYAGPYDNDYVGPWAGASHMHMIETWAVDVMKVMAKWVSMNVSNPVMGSNHICGNAWLPPN